MGKGKIQTRDLLKVVQLLNHDGTLYVLMIMHSDHKLNAGSKNNIYNTPRNHILSVVVKRLN